MTTTSGPLARDPDVVNADSAGAVYPRPTKGPVDMTTPTYLCTACDQNIPCRSEGDHKAWHNGEAIAGALGVPVRQVRYRIADDGVLEFWTADPV